MQTALYLGIILLARVVQAIFDKRSSNEVQGLGMTAVYSAYKFSISALLGLVLLVPALGQVQVTPLAVGISLLSGLSLLAAGFCGIYAMKSGTVSLASMFSTAGLLVPVLAGALWFDQPVQPLQIAGIGLFFVAAWLLMRSSRAAYPAFSFKTVALLVGSMLSNGVTMLAQQLYTRYVPSGSVALFSFVSFACVALLGLPLALVLRRLPEERSRPLRLNRTLLLCGAALAGALFVINQLATTLTTALPPVVLFTVINGGATIISTLVAAILYGERLTVRSVAGVLLGILSMVIIKLFGG